MSYTNDWLKVILAEMQPAITLQTASWTNTGVGNTYYCAFGHGQIMSVQVNGVCLTVKTSIAACQGSAGSYFYDFWAQRLYIHLTDGGDPGEHTVDGVYTYSVVAYFILCFANGQYTGADCIDYIPEGCTYPVFYEPWLNENSIESLSASVADHYSSAMEVQFGSLSLINAAWWYDVRKTYLWNNKDIKIKVGSLGDAYVDFETIFIGKIRGPRITDEGAVFDLVDSRVGRLRSLPIFRYNLTDYPNLDQTALDRPVPVLFGQVENITPVCIDTTTFQYVIGRQSFGGVAYGYQSLDAVYKAGILLTVGVDYTVIATNNIFTLLVDPGDAEITCDAKGVKDGFDMSTGLRDSTYSENVADHLFFILHVLNEIPITKIDLASFAELKAARTQKVVLYLDTDTPTLDINRLFQQSTIYHFLPLLNGTFAARYYRRTVPAGTMELHYYDYDGFALFYQPENVYRDIIIKYDKDPTTGIFKTVSVSNSAVQWKHDERQQIEIETALRDTAEAESVRTFYVALLNAPGDKLDTTISLVGRNLLPTDKLIVSREIESEAGSQTVLAEEIYIILETRKDLAAGKVDIVAQLDSQLTIFTTHADVHADHTDGLHTDTHGDEHGDIHADSPHADTHGDHSDTLHSDAAHSDSHTDTHADIPPYTDHDDQAHSDREHEDHLDEGHYVDRIHLDEPHEDHNDNIVHSDAHGDVAHKDSTHSDHTDTSHLDTHADVSHIDSEV